MAFLSQKHRENLRIITHVSTIPQRKKVAQKRQSESEGRQGLPEREAVEGDAHTGSWMRSRLRGQMKYLRYLNAKRSPKSDLCVEVSGLEPKLAEPKSVVLPLHHTSIPIHKYKYFSVYGNKYFSHSAPTESRKIDVQENHYFLKLRYFPLTIPLLSI